MGGLVRRQSADDDAQNGGDRCAGCAELADLHAGLQRGLSVLRVGSTGSDVSDLQARLTELGYYTGTIDGKYSTGTQSAVTEFQSRNGLTADGIAGRATQDKLYSASAQPKTVSASAVDSGYTLLKEGASGLEVRKLQGRLAELGYYAGGVDGIYGSTTTSAVKAFQRANGLSGDGQAGSQTQTKLYSASAKYAASPVATANPDQTRTLTVGMTGNDVYALQERLIELNYLRRRGGRRIRRGDAERADGVPEPKRPDGGRHGGRKHAQKAERKLQTGRRDS